VASEHNITKPFGSGDTVNDTVVQRQFTLLSGEICSRGGLSVYGSLIEVWLETVR
jgi:hypothetical protein